MYNQRTKQFFSCTSYPWCPPLESKVLLLHTGRSYLCPRRSWLKECKAVSFAYLIINLPEFEPIYAREKGMSFDLLNSVHSEAIFGICYKFSSLANAYLIKSAAWGLTSASRGITKYFFQFWILCQVSAGSSDAKGGYPTSISYKITPIDHQSTVSLYPIFPCTSGAT